MTHICVSKLTFIGSDNGLSPRRRQAIIWTNARILLIGPLGTKFSEILIEIVRVSFKKMRLKGSSANWRPFGLGLNVLNHYPTLHSCQLLAMLTAVLFWNAKNIKYRKEMCTNFQAFHALGNTDEHHQSYCCHAKYFGRPTIQQLDQHTRFNGA